MTQVYPVGGGKGGIGKSIVAASMGTLLARQGRRVLLVDLDLGGSNLHSFLGMQSISRGLDTYLDKSVDSLEKAALPTFIENLFIISSKNCSIEAANLYTAQKQKIIRNLSKLDYDDVVLDLGGGTHFNLLDFFLASRQGICVLTPEPTAIENTFNFIKAIYFRVVKNMVKSPDFAPLLKGVDLSSNRMDHSFRIIDVIGRNSPEAGRKLIAKLNQYQFKFVVNQARANDDPLLGKKIETVCARHFHTGFNFAGTIRYDDRVRESIVLGRNFISHYAHTRTAHDLSRIARYLIAEQDRR